jgi:hypothetical protein
MQEANGEDSSRVDIPKDAVNSALLRQPGVEYVFNEVQPDFVAIQDEAIGYLIDLLASSATSSREYPPGGVSSPPPTRARPPASVGGLALVT